MKNILLLLLSGLLFQSCGQDKGCTNEWGSNFDNEALVDCCCEYDVQKIIAELVGSYEMKEKCSGNEKTYTAEIKANPVVSEGIIVSNFNNSGFDAAAKWNNGEFKFDNKWAQNACTVTLTGSVNKGSNKIFFVFASFPENTCADTQGITCEARQI